MRGEGGANAFTEQPAKERQKMSSGVERKGATGA